jgi:hypothetical protein
MSNGYPKGFISCNIRNDTGSDLVNHLMLRKQGCRQCEAFDGYNEYRYPVLKGSRCEQVTKKDCENAGLSFCPGSPYEATEMLWKVKTGKCVSNCNSGTCLHF